MRMRGEGARGGHIVRLSALLRERVASSKPFMCCVHVPSGGRIPRLYQFAAYGWLLTDERMMLRAAFW